MTIGTWLKESTALLAEKEISTARLDCLVLLQDSLERDKSWVLAHMENTLPQTKCTTLNKQIKRRMEHEPLAYIRGKSEFYGREFKVSVDTLQPRPETETMVELLLNQVKSKKLNVKSIADIGTGSGCIAITIARELPDIDVVGTDISKKCVQVARQNAKAHSVEPIFSEGNLFEPIPSSIFHLPYAIVANLPYVPDTSTINYAAMYEPRLAIFGGADGLDLYRQLFKSFPAKKPVQIYTESLPTQHAELKIIATSAGYKEKVREDFIQIFELIT